MSWLSTISWDKQTLLVAIKAAITGVLLYAVMYGVDLDRLRELTANIQISALAYSILLHMVAYFLGGIRWWLLARHSGLAGSRFSEVFPSYYLGVFFNNFLPTGIGGDLVRILHLRRRHKKLGVLVTSTIGDRIVGLLVVLATGLIALSTLTEFGIDRYAQAILTVLALLAVAFVVALNSGWLNIFMARLARRFERTRIRKAALAGIQSLLELSRHKGALAIAIGISLAVQSLIIFSYYILSRDIGLTQPLQLYFVIVPIIFLAASVPISIGGLGVREGILVTLLVAAGADKTQAITLAAVYLGVLWLSSLPGALTLLTLRQSPISQKK